MDRSTYNVDECAALLGVSRSSAYAAVKSGRFQHFALGIDCWFLVPRLPRYSAAAAWWRSGRVARLPCC